jgi:REP element-mobilizing transposase RayT
MMRNTVRGHRRSIRLDGYDYASAGAYLVTICAQDRACVFGTIADGVMQANDAGRMVERWWNELPRAFADTETDAFVVMPNHVHGVVVLVGADLRVCPTDVADQRVCPDGGATGVVGDAGDRVEGEHVGSPLQGSPQPDTPERKPPRRASLPRVVQWFKTMTTNEYIRGVRRNGWPAFRGRLWQRNYYEQIIRDEGSLNRVRAYVSANPARWLTDRDNQNPIHGTERRPND